MYLLIALHVIANLLWIGAIASVGYLLAAAAKESDPARAKTTAELANLLYRRIATPAFIVSFLVGVTSVALRPGYYLSAHWFHGKLTFALVVIALHHIIGAKSKRAASGSVQAGGSSAILTVALLVAAFATVVFVVYKTQLVP